MLLIDDPSVAASTQPKSVRRVTVISEHESDLNNLAKLLRSNGIDYVDTMHKSFFGYDVSIAADETAGVVVDIGSESDIDKVARRILAIIPQGTWCCVVGRSDSLSLAQQFLAKNIFYFNIDFQLDLMIERILSGQFTTVAINRNAVNVCVMGCKGGVGGSFVAAQLAVSLANNRNVSVLLAQGSNGSQDLDLLFDRKLSVDVAEFSEKLGLFIGDYNQIPNSRLNNYNFVIYDKPINNLKKDECNELFNVASSFVLVVERHPNSLRVAKRFLDLCEKQRDINKRSIRTFICINDSRQEYATLMSKLDLEALLGAPVDAVIPFIKNVANGTINEIKISKAQQANLNSLCRVVTGEEQRKIVKEDSGSLKSLFQKIIN